MIKLKCQRCVSLFHNQSQTAVDVKMAARKAMNHPTVRNREVVAERQATLRTAREAFRAHQEEAHPC